MSGGKVRYVYREMAVLGQESEWAAEAAECAADQGRFWDYHDKLFASQNGENKGTFTKANLKKFATDVGLQPSFATCLDSDKYLARVRAETQTGAQKGVTGTPTFFINGKKYEGVLSFDQLKQIIEPILATATPVPTASQ